MGGRDVADFFGNLLQGFAIGQLNKVSEEKEDARAVDRAIRKYKRVQDELSKRPDLSSDDKQLLLEVMGFKPKQESEVDKLAKILRAQNLEKQGQRLDQQLAGTTPADKLAATKAKEKTKNDQQRALHQSLTMELKGVEDEEKTLLANFKVATDQDPFKAQARKSILAADPNLVTDFPKRQAEIKKRKQDVYNRLRAAGLPATPTADSEPEENTDDLFNQLPPLD